MTGTERATGGTPGKWEGVDDAEIYVGGQEAIFRGSLEIRPMGAAYTLNWVGTQNSAERQFVNIYRDRPCRSRQCARRRFPGKCAAKRKSGVAINLATDELNMR